jgi:surface protein
MFTSPLYSDDLFLDPNGVTLKAKENAILGAYYSFNSEIYRVVDDALLRALVVDDQDLSKLVTTRVTDLNNLFAATTVNFDLTSWDVCKVTDMKDLFYQASSFNQDLSAWKVGNVTAMAEIFYGSVAFNHELSA